MARAASVMHTPDRAKPPPQIRKAVWSRSDSRRTVDVVGPKVSTPGRNVRSDERKGNDDEDTTPHIQGTLDACASRQ